MAEKAGFSLNDLFGKRGARKGSDEVKYRNPKDTSQTWTGRGRKPNWLVDAVKKGAKIDTFIRPTFRHPTAAAGGRRRRAPGLSAHAGACSP